MYNTFELIIVIVKQLWPNHSFFAHEKVECHVNMPNLAKLFLCLDQKVSSFFYTFRNREASGWTGVFWGEKIGLSHNRHCINSQLIWGKTWQGSREAWFVQHTFCWLNGKISINDLILYMLLVYLCCRFWHQDTLTHSCFTNQPPSELVPMWCDRLIAVM